MIDLSGNLDLPSLSGDSQQIPRRSALPRTPPQSQGVVNGRQENEMSNAQTVNRKNVAQTSQATEKADEVKNAAATVGQVDGKNDEISTQGSVPGTSQSVPGSMEDMRGREENELNKIKEILANMKAATLKQPNISRDVKDGLNTLEGIISAISFYRRKWKAVEQQIGEQIQRMNQGTPKGILATEKQVIVDPRGGSGLGTPGQPGNKKRVASSPAGENEGKKPREETQEDGFQRQESKGQRRRRKLQEELQSGNKEELLERTDTTTPKDRKRRSKRKRTRRRYRNRPEALVITLEQGQTYADVLKEIKTKANPADNNVEINKIRGTKSGNILLELGHNSNNEGKEAFSATLKTILGDKSVRMLEPKRTVEIRDLDSTSVTEDVEKAIREATRKPNLGIKVTLLRTNNRQQRVALVEMPEREANILIEASRVRIGWVICRVRERINVTRCFKCFGYGHIQANCGGPDRSEQGLCRQCGEAGHKKIDCKTKEPKCFLCSDGNFIIKHVAGSRGCRAFRDALEAARKNTRRC